MIKTKNKFGYFKTAYKELLVILFVIFLDVFSKLLVSHFMIEDGPQKRIIPKLLSFKYTKNDKAAFGFDFFGLSEKFSPNQMRWFFIAFVCITTLIFFIFLVVGRKNCFIYRLSLALIVGGAIGNLYDRIAHKGVRDFLQVKIFDVIMFNKGSFPTFNLADSALVVGVGLFLIYFLFFFTKDEKRKQMMKNDANKE